MSLLTEYVKLIWPLIEYCTNNVMDENGKVNITRVNKHQWYLYRQAFYGFSNFLEIKTFYSEQAQKIFEILCEENKAFAFKEKTLAQVSWEEQPIFDPGRRYIILEHMYTGTMFRKKLLEMSLRKELTIDAVVNLIKKNYNICWIEKHKHHGLHYTESYIPENKRIHKTKRGDNVFEYYDQSAGIKIINLEQKDIIVNQEK